MYYFNKDTRRLDLWYPFENLKQEIGMRTAYLGKLRSSEQVVHLLDLIHMTDDEEELMMSFANNAMAEVYECFSKYARHLHVPTMVFNDGKLNTIKTQAIPEVSLDNISSITFYYDGLGEELTLYRDSTRDEKGENFQFAWSSGDGSLTVYTSESLPGVSYSGVSIDAIGSRIISQYYTINVAPFTHNTQINNNHISLDISATINERFDESKYGVKLNVLLTYKTSYTIIETGTNVLHETIKVPLSIIATKDASGKFIGSVVYTANLSPATDTLSASFIDSCSVEFDSVELFTLSSETISKFVWVEYDNTLWFSLVEVGEDTFIHTMMGRRENRGEFILYPVDPRYSIRYHIEYVKELSVHYIQPLDFAIKEALVCYIIAHWLEYAYPNEAANWHAKYEKALSDVRKRCNVQEKPIKKLIPRWL